MSSAPNNVVGHSTSSNREPERENLRIDIAGSGNRHNASLSPSSTTLQDASNQKIRFRFILTLISTLDVGISILISYLILSNLDKSISSLSKSKSSSIFSTFFSKKQSSTTIPDLNPLFINYLTSTFSLGSYHTDKDAKVLQLTKLTYSILACSVVKCSTLLIVSVSQNIRNLGILVGAVCMLSTLFNVSVANLLFQGRSFIYPSLKSFSSAKGIEQFLLKPTLPIFISFQLFFTLLEWLVYVAIVAERNQRGGVANVKARRKRTTSGVGQKSKTSGSAPGRGVSRQSIVGEGAMETDQDTAVGSQSSHGTANQANVEDNAKGGTQVVTGNESETQPPQSGHEDEAVVEEEDEDTEISQDDDEHDDEHDYEEIGDGEEGEVSRDAFKNQITSTSSQTNENSSLLPNQSLPPNLPVTPNRNSRPIPSVPTTTSNLESQRPNSEEIDDEEEEDRDPNEIIDITPNKKLSRKESKKRLKRSMSNRIDKLKGRFGFRSSSSPGFGDDSINEIDERMLEPSASRGKTPKGKGKGKAGKGDDPVDYGTFS